MRITTQLWDHQEKMCQWAIENKRGLLLGGTGTGKTLAMLATMARLKYKRTLVLTVKAALRSVWQEEVERFTEGARVLVLDQGTSATKRERLSEAMEEQAKDGVPLIVVVNYETARLLPLEKWDWDFAVADESHKLKAYNSAVSNQLAAKCRHIPHKIAMTGTPWSDRPLDVYGQERWLNPGTKKYKYWTSKTFGPYTAFFEDYTVYRTVNNIKIPEGYVNLDELAAKLADHFLYIDRDKVRQTKGVQMIERSAYLSEKHMQAYQELKREMLLEIGEDEITVDNQMVLALRLHQIAGGFYQPDGALAPKELPDGEAKLDALEGIVETLGDEPFVVFTRFREDVTRVKSRLKKLGIQSLELTGARDEHYAWRKGKGQALVANISAGSAGINLTRAAFAIYYSTGYSATDFIQSLGRIDRPGQERPVTIYHIVARGTIDEDIKEALWKKRQNEIELLNKAKGS